MKASADTYFIIKLSEGCVYRAYPDPGSDLAKQLQKRGLWRAVLAGGTIQEALLRKYKGDPWTIGWGHTGPEVKYGLEWTQKQCDDALVKDVEEREPRLLALLNREPTQKQFDALMSFFYNVGEKQFKDSTLRKLYNLGEITLASQQFGRWIYSGGQRLEGLRVRRERERKLFLGEDIR